MHFLLRHGEDYIYRYLTGWFASDSYEEYRYTLRAAMHMAERFRYGEERSQCDAEHPWRTLINRLLWIERLSDEGFKLWVNNEYGPLKRDGGHKDQPIELLERLFKGEVLKHHRAANAAEDSSA